ncbi:MAG TPA: YceI family protein [Thiothrix sp.]|nr:YceI family protein [Thiothrix sp.]
MKTLGSIILAFITTALFISPSFADTWTLDSADSSLHFISIKKGDIAEVHHFKTLSGSIAEDGKASLVIDLASADTKVAVRDERMTNILFEAKKFTTATASIDLGTGERPVGRTTVKVTLDLHGVKKEVEAQVVVSVSDKYVSVTTVAPVIISAADFGLDAGVEKLRELAKLDAVSKAVPVTFHLVFKKVKK